MSRTLHVALTFDDGYVKHYDIARSLDRLDIKATFFIITNLKSFEGRALLTSRPELIKEIKKKGHEIGSHTRTHPNLTTIPSNKVDEEVRESKQLLEELTCEEVRGFAYPYGVYDASVIKIVSKYYEYARGAGHRTQLDDPLNVRPTGSHNLGSLVPRGLPERKYIRRVLPSIMKVIRHEDGARIRIAILTMHTESLPEVLAIIAYLTLLPGGTCFVTMRQLVQFLRSNC